MNKQEYLSRLRKALKNVGSEDAVRLVEYYRELIEDAAENGGEEQFISTLEPPELVAENFIRENGESGYKDDWKDESLCKENKTSSNGGDKLLNIVLLIPIIIATFVVGVVIFAFAIASVIVNLVSAYVIISGVVLVFSRTAVGFAQIGLGISLFFISLLLGMSMSLLGKLSARAIRFLRGKEAKNNRRIGYKRYIFALSGVIVGIVIFVMAFASIGFNVNKLACVEDITAKRQTIVSSSDALALVSDNLALNIKYTDGNEIILEYNDFGDSVKEFSNNGETATLKSKGGGFSSFVVTWERGVFFSMLSYKYSGTTLYLPRGYINKLSVDIENGMVDAQQMEFDSLEISTSNGAINLVGLTVTNLTAKTYNGLVNLENVNASSIIASTSNGAVVFDYCTAEAVNAKTHNGAILLERLKANEIELNTSNGSISGSILGSRSDYVIISSTGNGSNWLGNKDDGSKILKARTGNGEINVTFTE